MATRNTTTAQPALELSGTVVGIVRSLQLPAYHVDWPQSRRQADGTTPLSGLVGVTGMRVEADLAREDLLLGWALSLLRGNPSAIDGAALVLNGDGTLSRRVEWTDGLITELIFPTLDAAGSKQVCTIALSWQPGTVRHDKASGPAVKLPTGKLPKSSLSSNFRVLGLPFDGSVIRKVVLPTVRARVTVENVNGDTRGRRRRTTDIDLGELSLECVGRSRDEALAWVEKAVQNGLIGDDDRLALSVELLDATLKKALVAVALSDCGLLSCEESLLGANQDALPTVTLRFAVGKLDLKFSGA